VRAHTGWFNSCKCWAAVWTLPKVNTHYIPMGLSAKERELARTYYGLIGGALALQFALSAAVLWHYHKELRLIYGSWVESCSPEQPRIECNGDAAQRGEGQRQHGESDGELDEEPNGESIRLLNLSQRWFVTYSRSSPTNPPLHSGVPTRRISL
jgi:hypothetical protein